MNIVKPKPLFNLLQDKDIQRFSFFENSEDVFSQLSIFEDRQQSNIDNQEVRISKNDISSKIEQREEPHQAFSKTSNHT